MAEGHIPFSKDYKGLENLIPKSANQMLRQKIKQGFPSYDKLGETFLNLDKP